MDPPGRLIPRYKYRGKEAVIKAIVRKVNEVYRPQEPDLVADDLSGQQ